MRRAPSSPADIARRRAERANQGVVREMIRRRERETVPTRYEEAGLSFERALALEAQGVDFAVDHAGRLKRAHRGDVFHRMAQRDAITTEQHAAVRRLERDLALRAGLNPDGASDRVMVDCSGDREGVTQRQVDAGKRVDEVLTMVGPPASRVLSAILEAGLTGADAALREEFEAVSEDDDTRKRRAAERAARIHLDVVDWRAIVQRLTGEARAEAQTAILRFACQGLVDVYSVIDRRKRGT